jgi:hypothetical protein
MQMILQGRTIKFLSDALRTPKKFTPNSAKVRVEKRSFFLFNTLTAVSSLETPADESRNLISQFKTPESRGKRGFDAIPLLRFSIGDVGTAGAFDPTCRSDTPTTKQRLSFRKKYSGENPSLLVADQHLSSRNHGCFERLNRAIRRTDRYRFDVEDHETGRYRALRCQGRAEDRSTTQRTSPSSRFGRYKPRYRAARRPSKKRLSFCDRQ